MFLYTIKDNPNITNKYKKKTMVKARRDKRGRFLRVKHLRGTRRKKRRKRRKRRKSRKYRRSGRSRRRRRREVTIGRGKKRSRRGEGCGEIPKQLIVEARRRLQQK